MIIWNKKLDRFINAIMKFNDHPNIYLVGMPGSGKSTVGILLAQQMGYEHFDTDSMVIEVFGREINEIFDTLGEDVFRQAEREITTRLLATTGKVISTGGGIVSNKGLIEKLNKNGITIYLQVKTDTIAERLEKDDSRPLLKPQTSSENFVDKIDMILNKREQEYLKSQIIVDGERSPADVVQSIIEIIVKK